ncbi:TPA: 23S rRNA methyltransferase attenuation leader peptide [Streptococcus pyogenes]
MYFRSSSDILAGRTKSVQIDIAILEQTKNSDYADK